MNQDQLDYVVFKLWKALSSSPASSVPPRQQPQYMDSGAFNYHSAAAKAPFSDVPQFSENLSFDFSGLSYRPDAAPINPSCPNFMNSNLFSGVYSNPVPTANPVLPPIDKSSLVGSDYPSNLDFLIDSIMSSSSSSPIDSVSPCVSAQQCDSFIKSSSDKPFDRFESIPHNSVGSVSSPVSSASTKCSPSISSSFGDVSLASTSPSPNENELPSDISQTQRKDPVNIRKRCDNDFLASLPPQLALKRRRARSAKQTAIIEELLNSTSNGGQVNDSALVSSELAPQLDTVKRHRNTDAARRSRLRKALRMETLEKQVVELELENSKLRDCISSHEAAKLEFLERELSLKQQIRDMTLLLEKSISS
ncbi:hypothetical protein AYI68_g7616 [Smittium mucronatum]|uniref:BZIP domain-containing protein n=1 Tax=Smittium mucronatum TaxID=133383 RepID=A0A1R0GN76_9FUNG|nr:hypothetical protein AYI68_g7616 [Smittium mucronatum]